MKRIRVSIGGSVQGVLFRYSTKREAEQLGLVGYARNEPDGRVTIIAEGEETALRALIAWCYNGPRQAAVGSVNVVWESATEKLRSFEIR